MLRILIGGSPCTHWSIAQTKNRETTAEGIGWELFLNYRIARDKYQPDYFLYENNKSMSPAIRAQITAELGVEPVLINSALVSAQNRQRLYWVGKREPGGTYSQVRVDQPKDRGILLRDILETGVVWREKGYAPTTAHNATTEDMIARNQRNGVAEPIRVGTIENDAKNPDHDSQQYRVYSPDGKSVTLCGNGDGVGAKTGLYALPVALRVVGRRINDQGHRDDYNDAIPYFQYFEVNKDPQKSNCLTTVQKDNMVAVPVEEGDPPNAETPSLFVEIPALKNCDIVITDSAVRLQRRDAKHSTVQGSHINFDHGKSQTLSPTHIPRTFKTIGVENDGGQIPVYQVRGGRITIKGKEYPIKLDDGFYIIRKLTVTECKRLQTVPDTYTFPVSDTQAYKMLGNGWTVDVIAHIMSHFDGLTTGPVEVLSMYDGMSCGHIALDKLGVSVTAYYATEIDKYAIQTTQHNYPDTVQLGDAFQVRKESWKL